MSSYAALRNAQRAKNIALLENVNLELMPQAPASASIFSIVPESTIKFAHKKPSTASKKRRSPKVELSTDEALPRRGSRSSTRTRKTRFAHQKFSDDDYSDDESDFSVGSDEDDEAPSGSSKKRKSSSGIPQRLSGFRPNPKHFGNQPGTEVGEWWRSRMECSQAGIHAPTVAGISGNPDEGTWSIALSGGYPEDIDFGYTFSYTGSGGRDLKGTAAQPKNLRTAPQTFDQTFTALNAALKRSVETSKPVRVVRGFKNPSPFAPIEGYSYSGLYLVTKAWMDVGESGFKVTRFSFVRMAGQAPLPIQPGREDEAAEIIARFGKSSKSNKVDTPSHDASTVATPSTVDSEATVIGSVSPTLKRSRAIKALPVLSSPRTPIKVLA